MEKQIYSEVSTAFSQEPTHTGSKSLQADAGTKQVTVYRIVGVCFGLLCLLQVTLNITLRLRYEKQELLMTNYTNATEETGQLPMNFTDLIEDGDIPQANSTDLPEEGDILQTNYTDLAEEKHVQTNYTSLLEESVQTNYTDLDERDLLLSNLTDVVEQVDLFMTRYRNLTQRNKLLLLRFNDLAKEKKQLLTIYNKLAEEKNKLMTSYNKMAEERFRLHMTLEDAGWKRFRSSIYFFSTMRKTWYQAREDCKQRGADLVIINSKEEQTFLSARRTVSWIGLTDTEREGVWRWLDGTQLTIGYWWSGQPNDYRGNQDCARFYKTKWDDRKCSEHLIWTCEKQV